MTENPWLTKKTENSNFSYKSIFENITDYVSKYSQLRKQLGPYIEKIPLKK